MLLFIKSSPNAYEYGLKSYYEIVNFLRFCNEEGWTITMVDDVSTSRFYNVLTVPYEDSTIIFIYLDNKLHQRVYYIISSPYNMVPGYVDDMLDKCGPKKYTAIIKVPNTDMAQLLQFRLAAMEKEWPKMPLKLRFIQKHLNTLLGIESVWGFNQPVQLSKTILPEYSLSISFQVCDDTVSAEYTLKDLNKETANMISKYFYHKPSMETIDFLCPRLKNKWQKEVQRHDLPGTSVDFIKQS